MTLQEAQALCEKISLLLNQDDFLLHRLSEDDWCIILKTDSFYVRSGDDWTRYKRRLEARRRRKQAGELMESL
jgi:hypothetical protein